ncbi:hypothetical protein QQ045_029851 [Rhodiola kirilowii]
MQVEEYSVTKLVLGLALRLGGKSAFVGKLGYDDFGHMLAGILRDNDVIDGGNCFNQGAHTTLAFRHSTR